MSVGSSTSRVIARLEAADMYFGLGHCRSWTAVADSSGSLNDTYFDVNVLLGDGSEKMYYVWYNVNSAGTDPAISGKTGVEVALATDATAEAVVTATIAALVAAEVEVFSEIDSSNSALFRLENWYPGSITAETDSGSTGFTPAVLQAGSGGYLGATSDAIEVASETTLVDIQANQFGGQILDQIISGQQVNLTAALLEMTTERWENIIGNGVGDVETSGSSDVVGFGESKLFQNLSEQGGRLILHPKRLAATDRSADWIFWKSAPVPESFNFDGNSPQALSVSFTAYLDANKSSKINLAARGDWTQSALNA